MVFVLDVFKHLVFGVELGQLVKQPVWVHHLPHVYQNHRIGKNQHKRRAKTHFADGGNFDDGHQSGDKKHIHHQPRLDAYHVAGDCVEKRQLDLAVEGNVHIHEHRQK